MFWRMLAYVFIYTVVVVLVQGFLYIYYIIFQLRYIYGGLPVHIYSKYSIHRLFYVCLCLSLSLSLSLKLSWYHNQINPLALWFSNHLQQFGLSENIFFSKPYLSSSVIAARDLYSSCAAYCSARQSSFCQPQKFRSHTSPDAPQRAPSIFSKLTRSALCHRRQATPSVSCHLQIDSSLPDESPKEISPPESLQRTLMCR